MKIFCGKMNLDYKLYSNKWPKMDSFSGQQKLRGEKSGY
jgi:hypothetical protein